MDVASTAPMQLSIYEHPVISCSEAYNLTHQHQQEKMELREVFLLCDHDQSGAVDWRELRAGLRGTEASVFDGVALIPPHTVFMHSARVCHL